jgi:hypothetical protein
MALVLVFMPVLRRHRSPRQNASKLYDKLVLLFFFTLHTSYGGTWLAKKPAEILGFSHIESSALKITLHPRG